MTPNGNRYATKNLMTCLVFSVVLLLWTPLGRHIPSTMSVAMYAMVTSNAGIASQMNTIAPNTSRRFFAFVYNPAPV